MKYILALLCACLLLAADGAFRLHYPPAPKSNRVDDYHGVKIADPYRSLENADAPSTQKWIEDENALTFSYLARLPGRDAIKKQLSNLWNYERFSDFYKAGNHFFYWHRHFQYSR